MTITWIGPSALRLLAVLVFLGLSPGAKAATKPDPCPKDAKAPSAAVVAAFGRLVAAETGPDEAQRSRRAGEVLGDVLDAETFAKRALSKAWTAARKPVQQRWVRILGAMLKRKIRRRLAQPQQYVLQTRKVNLWCTNARVEAMLTKRKGRYRRDLVLRLAHSSAGWRIFDLAVDGNSLLATWRRRFSWAYRDDGVRGVDAMLRRLDNAAKRPRKR